MFYVFLPIAVAVIVMVAIGRWLSKRADPEERAIRELRQDVKAYLKSKQTVSDPDETVKNERLAEFKKGARPRK